MSEIIANSIMTIVLFPISMLLVGLYMFFTGPYSKKLYWGVVIGLYLVMLFICWGVETGYLYKMVR